VIFYSGLHRGVKARFGSKDCILINLETRSLSGSFENVLLLGRIFDREKVAEQAVREVKEQLALVEEKIKQIPRERKRRVMRLMGRDRVMTPGDHSFQNEMIQAAECLTRT